MAEQRERNAEATDRAVDGEVYVALISADLMCSSKIEGTIRGLSASLHVAAGHDDFATIISQLRIALVLVDLTTPMLNIAAVMDSVKNSPAGRGAVIAFGPHVHVDRLNEAKEAGCDEVMSRGQFFQQHSMIIARYLSGSSV